MGKINLYSRQVGNVADINKGEIPIEYAGAGHMANAKIANSIANASLTAGKFAMDYAKKKDEAEVSSIRLEASDKMNIELGSYVKQILSQTRDNDINIDRTDETTWLNSFDKKVKEINSSLKNEYGKYYSRDKIQQSISRVVSSYRGKVNGMSHVRGAEKIEERYKNSITLAVKGMDIDEAKNRRNESLQKAGDDFGWTNERIEQEVNYNTAVATIDELLPATVGNNEAESIKALTDINNTLRSKDLTDRNRNKLRSHYAVQLNLQKHQKILDQRRNANQVQKDLNNDSNSYTKADFVKMYVDGNISKDRQDLFIITSGYKTDEMIAEEKQKEAELERENKLLYKYSLIRDKVNQYGYYLDGDLKKSDNLKKYIIEFMANPDLTKTQRKKLISDHKYLKNTVETFQDIFTEDKQKQIERDIEYYTVDDNNKKIRTKQRTFEEEQELKEIEIEDIKIGGDIGVEFVSLYNNIVVTPYDNEAMFGDLNIKTESSFWFFGTQATEESTREMRAKKIQVLNALTYYVSKHFPVNGFKDSDKKGREDFIDRMRKVKANLTGEAQYNFNQFMFNSR